MFQSFTVSGNATNIASAINQQLGIMGANGLQFEVVSTAQSQCVWDRGEHAYVNVTVTVIYRVL